MDQKEHNCPIEEAIFSSMPEAVFLADRKWRIVMMNPSAEALTGHSCKSSTGRILSDILKLHDSQTRKTLKLQKPGNKSGNGHSRNYWNLVLSSTASPEIFVDCSVMLLNGTKQSQGCYLVTLKNVSEKTALDCELLNKSKISAIANLASSLAHDFTNTLAVISGHASAIADNLIPKTRAHEEALRILESAKRAGNLTKHLMSIARIGDAKADIKLEPVHLGNVVKDAVTVMEESCSSQTLTFKARNPDAMPYVTADERQILDCLINLMINSTEAMPKGGTITIDAEDITHRKTNYVALRIRDNGNGMSREVLSRVFDPFFTTKPAGTGIGLGLTVVRTSLQRWGGFVKVYSRPGHGTSVKLFLRKAKTQPPKDSLRGDKAGRETLHLVDDTPTLLEKSAQILKSEGYNIYKAENGEEGLRIYQKHADDIDLAIIDFVMPGANGKKVFEGLEINPTASIIMTSGFSREYVRISLEKGAWGYLQKPFSPEHLLTTVRRILDQHLLVKPESSVS